MPITYFHGGSSGLDRTHHIGCSVYCEAVSLVGGLATSCPWLHLCLWSISLVTDSDLYVRSLTVSLGSTAVRAREAELDRGKSWSH